MNAQKIPLQIDDLLHTFSIEKSKDSTQMAFWLEEGTSDLNHEDEQLLQRLHKRITLFIEGWNEEELKMNFISFVLFLADIDEPKRIRTFFERSLSGIIDGHSLSVKCDCMIASPKGIGTPQAPYFFLQEYKKSKGDKNDPEGQMLGGMILAQHLNADQKPVYGCWLVGQNWYFTLLKDKTYYMSQQFDTANYVQLKQVLFILRRLKTLILNEKP
jgi:hypothetical protein